MKYLVLLIAMIIGVASFRAMFGQDYVAEVRRVVERTTLDQAGTHPFHLKAEFSPEFERYKAPGHVGTIEIWWMSPTRWRREIHSTEFTQIEIVDGTRVWQKNSADYFPEWLREVAVALVRPVPNLDQVLAQVKTAEIRNIMCATHISWGEIGTDGTVSKGLGQGIDLNNDGPLFAGVIGSSASFKDLSDFHGRDVARKVSAGEVTARVSLLEDLSDTPPTYFNASVPGSDPLLETVVVKEPVERANILEDPKTPWPAVAIGPTEGAMLFEVVIDGSGKVREIRAYLSDNPALREVAEARVRAMRFQPYLDNGVPAQVVTTLTLPFKTTRPPGVEIFANSKDILDKARILSYPSAAGTVPYVLGAEFTTRNGAGEVVSGTYTDTWLSKTQWRREAVLGNSRLVRTQNGDGRYLLTEGPDAEVLRVVFEVMEPIPDTTSWYEVEWLVKHDPVDGMAAIRVSRGPVGADGVLDAQAQGLWFDDSGRLIKTQQRGIETRLLSPSEFGGMQIARRIDVLNQGKLALRLNVTQLSAAGTVDPAVFTLKGHDWVRQFTPEVR